MRLTFVGVSREMEIAWKIFEVIRNENVGEELRII